MPADALAPKVAYASAGMALVAKDWKHIFLFQRQFQPFESSQIQNTTQNVNIFYNL